MPMPTIASRATDMLTATYVRIAERHLAAKRPTAQSVATQEEDWFVRHATQ